jgi:hypothetical protein
MSHRLIPVLLILIFTVFSACNINDSGQVANTPVLDNLIPKPVILKKAEGFFSLNDSTFITVKPGNKELLRLAG